MSVTTSPLPKGGNDSANGEWRRRSLEVWNTPRGANPETPLHETPNSSQKKPRIINNMEPFFVGLVCPFHHSHRNRTIIGRRHTYIYLHSSQPAFLFINLLVHIIQSCPQSLHRAIPSYLRNCKLQYLVVRNPYLNPHLSSKDTHSHHLLRQHHHHRRHQWTTSHC